jgi:hypothetical protein
LGSRTCFSLKKHLLDAGWHVRSAQRCRTQAVGSHRRVWSLLGKHQTHRIRRVMSCSQKGAKCSVKLIGRTLCPVGSHRAHLVDESALWELSVRDRTRSAWRLVLFFVTSSASCTRAELSFDRWRSTAVNQRGTRGAHPSVWSGVTERWGCVRSGRTCMPGRLDFSGSKEPTALFLRASINSWWPALGELS